MSVPLLAGFGCSSPTRVGLPYLWQAGMGQLKVSNRARPISEVLKNERVPFRIRDLLSKVEPVKAFGESQGLKPTKNYQDYVAWDEPYVSYVVSACSELEFKPRTWSFPVVGSFTYLGWFDKKAAQAYASALRESGENLDVDVRGARAYSTLGWFKDPIISCMISEGTEALADLVDIVLHESVHATVYIKGQSSFNESLAEFVAHHLTEVYFNSQKDESFLAAWQSFLKQEERSKKYESLMHEAYVKLDMLYRSMMTPELKRVEKKKILLTLNEQLSTQLGIRHEINNATLIQFKTYRSSDAGFERLWNRCEHQARCLLDKVKTLTSADFKNAQDQDFSPILDRL